MWPLPELSSETLISHKTKYNENNFSLPPLILTHDVDTQFGFDHIRDVCEVEKRLGFKSSWNIVPDLYEVDESVLDYLRDSGMEIGVHDWNHDGRLFSSRKVFAERVKKINRVMKEWGAKGFRAGMVFHNDEWMQELECEYDSSHYDTDPYQPMGGGCGQIRPFMLGHLVELPYTMPQDHTLFVARAEVMVPEKWDGEEGGRKMNWEWIREYLERNGLATDTRRQTPVPSSGATGRAQTFLAERLARLKKSHRFAEKYKKKNRQAKAGDGIVLRGVDIWKMKAEWLMERGGMVLMITHPDYLCHPKLFVEGGEGRRTENVRRRAKDPSETSVCDREPSGLFHGASRDVMEVREKGIVEERWYGSLLEQYGAFLNWFGREFEGRYRHCLPWELADWYRSTSQRNRLRIPRDEGDKD